MRFFSPCALAAAVVCLAGCKSHPYDVVDVSGVVTINGKPVKDIRVAFQPTDTTKLNPGPGSVGVTDQEGRYTLKATGLGTNGAVVGEHAISFAYIWEGTDQPKPPDAGPPIPGKYRKQPIKFTVPTSGTREANFDLTP
jgi:hypothetical protein